MTLKMEYYKFSQPVKKEIRPLLILDNWHCWVALAEDILIIGISVFMAHYVSYYFYPLAVIIIGSRQRALATILHEASHGTMAKNRYLNSAMGTFFSGYLIFQTFSGYRKSHVKGHHGKFGNKSDDPDYKYAMEEGLYSPNDSSVGFFKKHIVKPFFLSKVPSYLRYLVFFRFGKNQENNKNELITILLYWLAIIAASIYYDVYLLLVLFWVVPYLTSFQIVGWFIELAEHYPLMSNKKSLYMTRNRHSSGIEKFLTSMHSENYHLVHHLAPKIPFWNQKKAHDIFMKDPNYAEWDKKTGGIFVSWQGQPSIIKSILGQVRPNSASQKI